MKPPQEFVCPSLHLDLIFTVRTTARAPFWADCTFLWQSWNAGGIYPDQAHWCGSKLVFHPNWVSFSDSPSADVVGHSSRRTDVGRQTNMPEESRDGKQPTLGSRKRS